MVSYVFLSFLPLASLLIYPYVMEIFYQNMARLSPNNNDNSQQAKSRWFASRYRRTVSFECLFRACIITLFFVNN